ncbi:MAG: OmpA family protein [Leadbetterella sp.]|nr:OmpA family protein [Leadbetterella sp.]
MRILLLCTALLTYIQTFAQKVETLGGAVNTEYSEIHPLIAPDGQTLYFVRVSHPSNNFGKDGSNDVWFSDLMSDKRWAVARKMANTINKDRYNDLFSITPDGNTALIRGVYTNGRKTDEVGISISKKKGTTWQQPNKLDIPKLDAMCKGQFLTAFLSNSGKVLILAFSEKKNSKEDDLYISILDKLGKWSKPESLGNDINTPSSETTPFLAADNNTLYFASDRKNGEGGFDIWVSKRKGKSWTGWNKPINLGKEINSDKDEMYFSIEASGEFGYMSSKNKAVGKSDLFKIRLREEAKKASDDAALTASKNIDTKKDIEKKEEIPVLAPTPTILLSGVVKDQKTGKPAEAKIIYEDLDSGEELGVADSNPLTGEYKISLPYGNRYAIRAEAKDFIPVSKNIDLTIQGSFKEIKDLDLSIAPIQTGVTVQLYNIFFKFGQATLEPESFFELDRMIAVMSQNPTMAIEVQGHTDNVGSAEANLRLSQQRADAVRDYFVLKKVSLDRVKSVGFGEAKPIASNATTEGQAKNRRVEFEIKRK